MQVPTELKIRYLSRRIQDIAHLRECLDQDDYSFALRLGHQVKGNATTFGVPQIAFLGHEIESAAKIKDKEQVKMLIQKMEIELHSVSTHF